MLGKLNAVIRQDRMDFVRHYPGQLIKEIFGKHARGTAMELSVDELGRMADRRQKPPTLYRL